MHVPYTNNTDSPKTIGLKRVDPGQTRMVEETLIPGYKPQGEKPEAPTDPVLELLDNKIGDIVPQLPDLSDEDFERLWQGEIDGNTRKGLIKAFEEEKLRRAEAKAEGGEGGQPNEGGEGGEGGQADDDNAGGEEGGQSGEGAEDDDDDGKSGEEGQ